MNFLAYRSDKDPRCEIVRVRGMIVVVGCVGSGRRAGNGARRVEFQVQTAIADPSSDIAKFRFR
jgi:hypothetical protein